MRFLDFDSMLSSENKPFLCKSHISEEFEWLASHCWLLSFLAIHCNLLVCSTKRIVYSDEKQKHGVSW